MYDNVFPLRLTPVGDEFSFNEEKFDSFIDNTFEPLLQTDSTEDTNPSGTSGDSTGGGDSGDGECVREYEVDKVVDKRVVSGVVSYRIKWKGYSNKHNVWRQKCELDHCVQAIQTTVPLFASCVAQQG